MDRVIKVKAFAVLLNASRSKHLEFGEPADDAVVREIVEELHAELAQVTLLGVIENVFTYAGAPGHEVVFVYAATVADGVVPEEGGWFDDGGPIRVEWRSVDVRTDIPLYPDGTQALIDDWISDRVAAG